MPVDVGLEKDGMIYQRAQYAKGGIGRRYWDYRDETIFKHVPKGTGALVEVGCGEGLLTEKAMKRFPDKDVSAIEPNPENVEICKSFGINVTEGSVYQLPFEDDSIDCVLFIEVVEHLDDPELALKELSRIVKPGGRLIMLFPNDGAVKLARIILLKFKEAYYNAGHVRQWTPRAARDIFKRNGLSVTNTKNMPFGIWPISVHHLIVGEK